jgi:hypothetical protein
MLTPDEAVAALEEARRVRRLGWRLVSTQAARLPLVWWGAAWLVSYPAVQFLPFAAAVVVCILATVAAFTLTAVGKRWDPAPGSTGWERQLMRSWWAVLAGGFLVNVIAAPAAIPVYFLIPGALWGVAMLLYAVVVGDVALGALGAGIAVLAAVLRVVTLDQSLVLFGVLGGGGMVAVGLVRVLGAASR